MKAKNRLDISSISYPWWCCRVWRGGVCGSAQAQLKHSQLTECGSYTAPASTPEPSPASSRTTAQGRLHRDMPCTCQLWPHAAWAPHVLATAACQPPPAWPHHKPVICEPGVWRERGWPPAASSGDTNWVKAALLTLPQTSLPLPFQLIATSQTWTVDTDTGLAISQCWCQQWWHGKGSQSNNHCTYSY